MKKFIILLQFLVLNANAQISLKSIKEKSDKLLGKIEQLNNSLENVSTIRYSFDSTSLLRSKPFESNCGFNGKTTERWLSIQVKNNSPVEILPYKDMSCLVGTEAQCLTSTNNLSPKLLGEYHLIFAPISKANKVAVTREIDQRIIELVPDLKKLKMADIYSLYNDSVFLTSVTQKSDLETAVKGDDKFKGNFLFRFENGFIYDTENKIYAKYTRGLSGNEFDILAMHVALKFIQNESKLVKAIDQLLTAHAGKKRVENEIEFKEKDKKCKYCNQSYTGESFDFPSWRSTKNPCSDKVEVVYKPAFCSRKCAYDFCNSTH
jgi:hypothetical protein